MFQDPSDKDLGTSVHLTDCYYIYIRTVYCMYDFLLLLELMQDLYQLIIYRVQLCYSWILKTLKHLSIANMAVHQFIRKWLMCSITLCISFISDTMFLIWVWLWLFPHDPGNNHEFYGVWALFPDTMWLDTTSWTSYNPLATSIHVMNRTNKYPAAYSV